MLSPRAQSRNSVMLSFSQMPPPLTLPDDLGGRSLVFFAGAFDPFIDSLQFYLCVVATVRIRLRSDSRNCNRKFDTAVAERGKRNRVFFR